MGASGPVFHSKKIQTLEKAIFMKLKMNSAVENEQVAGHPKAQTVGGKRVPGKARKNSGESEPTAATLSGVEINPTWVISGALQDQKQDFPTSAMKHMQLKAMPSKQKPHASSQTNRIIQQPRLFFRQLLSNSSSSLIIVRLANYSTNKCP